MKSMAEILFFFKCWDFPISNKLNDISSSGHLVYFVFSLSVID